MNRRNASLSTFVIKYCGLLAILISSVLGCSHHSQSIRTAAKQKLSDNIIVIRLSGTDCINCLVAYSQINKIIQKHHLDSSTVYLLGNVDPKEQTDFFTEILKSSPKGKIIVNNTDLFKSTGKTFSSSVLLYRKNKKYQEWRFESFDAVQFESTLNTLFPETKAHEVKLKGDSVGFFTPHYRDEDYVLFKNKIFSYSNTYGRIYSYQLPYGKQTDSIKLDHITAQLDYLECVKNAASDDTGSIRLTVELLNSGNNYFTQNPSYPKFMLTNVSTCDSFLCVSLYVTYFMKVEDPKSYGVNKRAILLLMDDKFQIKKKLFFSRAQMEDYWTFDYQNLHFDYRSNIIWKRIFIDSEDPKVTRYTLGKFSDNNGDNIYDLDTMLVPIPKLFITHKLYYNFLSAGFVASADTLLYYFDRIPEVYSLDSNVTTTFPQIDVSKLSANFKAMKFEFPYKAISMGRNEKKSTTLLVYTNATSANIMYEWRERPALFSIYHLPSGKLHEAFIKDDTLICIWNQQNIRKIEYYKLP